jgi:large subunit ribosomal protein L5
MSTTTAPPARLKTRYLEEIRPDLMSRFGYSSVMQAPRVEKITLNMGVGMGKQDSKVLKAAQEQLATIAGQAPSVRRGRKSIAAFKLREGMPVGVAVTLRAERCYEFLDRLVSVAIPRIRDFRGLNPRSFDGRGNYSLGVREQIIFPEIDYDAIDQVRGLDITITTTAATDTEAFALLLALGMPFAARGRPAGFEQPEDQAGAIAQAEPPDAPEPSAPAAAAAETETVADEPAAETETIADEPAAETETVADEPAAGTETVADEPAAGTETVADEPAAETETVADEPAAETVVDEPPAEDTTTEDAENGGQAPTAEAEKGADAEGEPAEIETAALENAEEKDTD